MALRDIKCDNKSIMGVDENGCLLASWILVDAFWRSFGHEKKYFNFVLCVRKSCPNLYQYTR